MGARFYFSCLFGCQFSVVSYHLSVLGYQSSVISPQRTACDPALTPESLTPRFGEHPPMERNPAGRG
jgi:hypothetical protein